ncbi:MAG: hypothetical protein Crog4KO_31240 [Crocinitomicaceae bacterium]
MHRLYSLKIVSWSVMSSYVPRTFIFLLLVMASTQVFGQSRNWSKDSVYLNQHLYDQPDTALYISDYWLSKTQKGTRKYAYLRSRKAVADDIQGRSSKAAEGFLEAIKIQEKIKDSIELSFSYNNLGICYFYQYRYDDAVSNYRNSARIDSLMNDLKGWSGTMINAAIIYSNQNKNKQALNIYNNILAMMNEVNDHSLDAAIYSNSAKLFILEKNYSEGLRRLNKVRGEILSATEPSPKMTLEVSTANAQMGLGRFDEALKSARRGLSYDVGNDYPERRVHLYECMSHAFYAKAMIDSGNYYNDLYQSYRDSLFTLETQEQLSEIQTKYGLAKRNEELAASRLKQVKYRNKSIKDARNASESREQRNLFIAIAAVFIIVGLLLFIILQKRRSERALLQENLNSQEQLVAQKEAFLGEIHHRVRNNLQMVSSMLAMQQMTSGEEGTKAILESSRSRIETMSLIHERLYKKSTGRTIELKDYVEQLTDQIVGAYSNKSIEVSYDVDDLRLHIDSVVPLALILNELITNSLKYAFGDSIQGKIRVSLKEVNQQLVLDYSDSGEGFDPDEGTGFGSRLLQSLSRQLKAKRETAQKDDGFHQKFYIRQYKKTEE